MQDSRRRIWIEAGERHGCSFVELNAWPTERCRSLWSAPRYPEDKQFSVAEMLELEQPQLMPMPEPFDGYVENPARLSSTCPVSVARNRCLMPCELAGQQVSPRLYPGRVVVVAVADDQPRANLLARHNAAPEPGKVETALTLSEPPKADAARYDSLRADRASQEDHHA